jgi:hypothetical protein
MNVRPEDAVISAMAVPARGQRASGEVGWHVAIGMRTLSVPQPGTVPTTQSEDVIDADIVCLKEETNEERFVEPYLYIMLNFIFSLFELLSLKW